MTKVNPDILAFLEEHIVPQYDNHDAGHRRDHAHHVMDESLHLAQFYPEVDPDMLVVAAAYHDLGLKEGREHHHEASARMLRQDERLLRWFAPEQLDIMADAAHDHRASLSHAPRTIYGCIIAESDRHIDGDVIIRRTIQYGLGHYPELDREGHWQRFLAHMAEKYARGGYLKLWIPQSSNARRLEEFRDLLERPADLRARFDAIFDEIKRN